MNASLTDIYRFLASQSIHLAILFFLIWILAVFFRRQSAHLRYLLWLVILAKCLVPSMVTIPMAVLPDTPVFLPEPIETLGKLPDEMASASPAGSTKRMT